MKPDAILEEVWNVKDRLATEAGYDLKRFFEQLEAWSQAHPHAGPVFKNADELRHCVEQREAAALREEPAAHCVSSPKSRKTNSTPTKRK